MLFFIFELASIILQFLLFIPFYIIWKNDCKEIGKENLAVSLSERFWTWIVCFPIWIVPIVIWAKN